MLRVLQNRDLRLKGLARKLTHLLELYPLVYINMAA
jgi:hypothetical protein